MADVRVETERFRTDPARRFLDVSPPISPRIANWPGDVPFSRNLAMSFGAGDHLELSSIETSLHVGAHADSTLHSAADGAGIDRAPLDRYFGACQVIQVSVPKGARIHRIDVTTPVLAPRVLFRTDSFPDPERWNEDFASLSPELVETLASAGVVLIGIDTPSVDPFSDRKLEAHRELAARGIAHLEGLMLGAVEAGFYTLAAFPLRIEGADASPVRAVLVDEGEPPLSAIPLAD
jgi:arylformamidase